jgi:hypothetical protein
MKNTLTLLIITGCGDMVRPHVPCLVISESGQMCNMTQPQ